jgi:PAS domain S-box-containing protein
MPALGIYGRTQCGTTHAPLPSEVSQAEEFEGPCLDSLWRFECSTSGPRYVSPTGGEVLGKNGSIILNMLTGSHDAGRPGMALDLRTVIDTIPALLVCALPDGSLEFVNQNWRESSLEQLTGWGWQSVIHPDDVSKFMDEWNAARTAGKPFENEARVRRADGQYHWFSIRKVPLRDQTGQIVRWFGTGYNIEDRKQGEDRLRHVVDHTPALIHTGRPDGYLDYFNRPWLEYLGFSLEDLCGWRWTDAIHPEDVKDILQKWRAAIASGEPFEAETRVRRADGQYRWMLRRKVPHRDSSGKILKWHGSSLDIEERKRAEEALQRSEFYLAEGQRLGHTASWAFDPSVFLTIGLANCFKFTAPIRPTHLRRLTSILGSSIRKTASRWPRRSKTWWRSL